MNEYVAHDKEKLAEFIQINEFTQLSVLYDQEHNMYVIHYK